MHLNNISLSVRKKNQQQIFVKDIIKSQKHPNTKPLAPEESIAIESYDSYSYEIVLSREQDGPREIFARS